MNEINKKQKRGRSTKNEKEREVKKLIQTEVETQMFYQMEASWKVVFVYSLWINVTHETVLTVILYSVVVKCISTRKRRFYFAEVYPAHLLTNVHKQR